MIHADRLTKSYGPIQAVRGISFHIDRGEVVGLLGPNGAGKTTTLRMLATALTPTSGRASLSGHDVLDEPVRARRHLGYLPEITPLYPEARVGEYLRFRAAIKDVPRRTRSAVLARVLQRCGLEGVADRVIGNLSRGYRQRVGLADALLADPPVLILDEPTAGLDPLQVREVRALIRELGRAHTLILSTHVLPEVEAVCSRALIVAGGRIVLDEPIGSGEAAGGLLVEVRGPAEGLRPLLESTPGVARVRPSAHGEPQSFSVELRAGAVPADTAEALARGIVQHGWHLRRLEPLRPSLEERFVRAIAAADPAEPEAA